MAFYSIIYVNDIEYKFYSIDLVELNRVIFQNITYIN